MEMRDFGRSGIRVSLLGFGCGAVGGLMVRGDPADQERTIARALEAGVNYFDTAVQYGEGASERNLGRVLKKLKPADAVVGTKVRLQAADTNRIENAIRQSLEGSLERLGRDHVDVFYLHNPITRAGGGDALSQRQVVEEVAPAFDRLRREGKIRIAGFTAIGDTDVLGAVTDTGMFAAAQVTYNMLNPSAAGELPAGYPAQDYARLLDRTQAAGVGVVGIRVLAGGALSGSGGAPPDRKPAAGADRFGSHLCGGPRACTKTAAAPRRGTCRQPAGSGDPLRDGASGDQHASRGNGRRGRIRAGARRHTARSPASRGARPAGRSSADVCRRGPMRQAAA